MVRYDKNFVLAAFEVVTPSLKGLNKSQEFSITIVILSFRKNDYLSEKD